MRFSPTSNFISASLGSGKTLTHKFYMRKTSNRAEGLNSGTAWIDVSDRISISANPDIHSSIEEGVGQYKTDSIDIIGLGIRYWKDNWFNTATPIEVKKESQIVGTTDIIPAFCGWVDRTNNPNELADTIGFNVLSAEDYGNTIPAELLAAQPISPNVDGSHNGLILGALLNCYIINANITSYVLQYGVHTLTCVYDTGNLLVNLDDGLPVNVNASGTFTLGNGATTPEDTQRVTIYVYGGVSVGTEEIIVLTVGETLPHRWRKNIQVRYLLPKMYTQMGITNVDIDNLETQTWDGNRRLFFLDRPIGDETVCVGAKLAIEAYGTNLFISFNSQVWVRTRLTGVYTLLTAVTGTVDRLIYNSRNGHLWIFSTHYVWRYIISTSTLSASVDLGTIGGYSVQLMDYNYTGSSWKYGLVNPEPETGSGDGGRFRFLDGTSLTFTYTILCSSIYTPLLSSGFLNHFTYLMASGIVRFRIKNSAGTNCYREFQVNSSGNWIDNGEKLVGIVDYTIACYAANETRIYYYAVSGIDGYIRSHTDASITPTTVYDGTGLEPLFSGLYYSLAESKTYLSLLPNDGDKIWSIVNNTTTLLGSDLSMDSYGIVYGSDRIYFLADDVTGYSGAPLYQLSNKLPFYIPTAQFTGKTITEALHEVLNSFFIIGKVGATKTAHIYRRVDDSGNIITSGYTLSVTANETCELEEEVGHTLAARMVSVSNGSITVTYDGVSYDAGFMTGDYTVDLNSEYIPSDIVKDMAYYLWQYFKNAHNLYTVKLGKIPAWQYEPFDCLSITYTTPTRIQKTGTGLIYSMNLLSDGSTEIGALI